MVVDSDTPEETGRRLLSAWNEPSSRLHSGTITGFIDFSRVRTASHSGVAVLSLCVLRISLQGGETTGLTLTLALVLGLGFLLTQQFRGLPQALACRTGRSCIYLETVLGDASSATLTKAH